MTNIIEQYLAQLNNQEDNMFYCANDVNLIIEGEECYGN